MKRIARSALACTIAGCATLGLLAAPSHAAGETGVASTFQASIDGVRGTYTGAITISLGDTGGADIPPGDTRPNLVTVKVGAGGQ